MSYNPQSVYTGTLNDAETRVLEALKNATKFRKHRRTVNGIVTETCLEERQVNEALQSLRSKRLAREIYGRRSGKTYWSVDSTY